jgi:hypothetical protein
MIRTNPLAGEVARLGKRSIKEVFTIVCLDDWYGLIATDLSPWIEVDTSIGYPWVVDRNTLEAIILKIDNLDKLTGFLRWRQSVQGIAVNEDEAVFAGFYATHGPAKFPEHADIVQLDANYADILEAAYFRRRGIDVPEPKPAAKPVFTQTRRQGDDLVFEIDGKVEEVINFRTGDQSTSTFAQEHLPKQIHWPGRIGRNDLCPCGSGLKYKRCCGMGGNLEMSRRA